MEDFFYDGEFCRMLEHLESAYQHDPARLTLVLNGDVFDFLTVVKVPEPSEARELGIKVSGAERRFGLNPTPSKSVYKLDQIIDGHPLFFRGLARFVAEGFCVHILRGNHDLELYFAEVCERLLERLAQFSGGPTIEEARQRITFHAWYYLEQGRLYIEHGNQYEASNSIRYPLRPVLPERRSRREGEAILDYPLGSYFVRYFYNSIHRINPHTPKVISFEQYLEFLRRHNVLDLLRIARDHYPFFARAVTPGPPAGTSGPSTENETRQEETFEALEKASDEYDFHRDLNRLKIHPLAASKAALAKQMVKPILRRLAWLGGVSLATLYVWLLVFNLIQATPWVAESVFAKAILLVFFALITAGGLFWLANHLARGVSRRTDQTVEMCADRADKIARMTGVKLVLMGHTHIVDVREIADGQATYANSGTWTSVDNPWDRLHPDARRFTLLKVSDSSVSVCRWNDDAGRLDPVPMFDLPEVRDLEPGALGELPPRRPAKLT
jgi:UDP-2,3-diacylglucosamine pyrophosphatase LpxH